MDPEKGEQTPIATGAKEVHAGWRYVKHVFPDSWKLKHANGATTKLIPTYSVHEVLEHDVRVVMTSRRTRKGRHPILEAISEKRKIEHVRSRTLLHPFGYKLWGWAPRNISYWVALAFTVGSVSWVVNGVFSMWPLKNEEVNQYIVGYTAVLGGGLFEVGSILAFLEYINSCRKKIDAGHRIEHTDGTTRVYHSKNDASYHRLDEAARPLQTMNGRQNGARVDSEPNGAGLQNGVNGQKVENGVAGEGTWQGHREPVLNGEGEGNATKRREEREKWRWCAFEPRSLAFWTVVSQLIGATIFAIPACITGVPNVLWTDYPPRHWVGWDILYWLPQVIASCFFILNSYLTMVETQHGWFGFKPFDIGWEAGFWNLIGAFGFFFSGLFGMFEYPAECCQKWGTFFSTFWGSLAFLISSYLLIPEALNK